MVQIIDKLKKFKSIFISIGVLFIIIGFFVFQNEKPTSLHGMLRQGDKYVKEGKISLALEHYLKTAKYHPRSYEAHMRLGDLFLQVKEPEKAKVEYYRAMKLGSLKKFDAQFAMANIYVDEGNFNFAQEIILSIKDIPNRKVQERIGDFYFNWSQKLVNVNEFDAVRMLRSTYEFYKKADSKKINKTVKAIESRYAKIADKLVSSNKIEDAIKILNLSVEFNNNALAHYKLAKIYENRNSELAIEEYEKAFKLNKYYRFDSSGFSRLLIEKGNYLKEQGDRIGSEYYYTKAAKLNPKAKIPYITDKHLILVLISARYNEDVNKDIVIPGISFRIMNVSKERVERLKAKVIFYDNEKYHSEKIIEIANPQSPLESDVTTAIYNVFSPIPINKVFAKHEIKVQVHISQSEPDKWKLYRNAYFEGVKRNRIILSDD